MVDPLVIKAEEGRRRHDSGDAHVNGPREGQLGQLVTRVSTLVSCTIGPMT